MIFAALRAETDCDGCDGCDGGGRARRGGSSAAGVGVVIVCVLLAGREGSRGGRPDLGACACAVPLTLGEDLAEVSGGFGLAGVALAASSCSLASRSRLVGGRGGRLAGLKAGGTLRPSDPWLVTDDMVRACERVDAVDCWENSEEPEPRLSLLSGCVEVRLGSVGAACEEAVRLGRGGCALRSSGGISAWELWVSRRGSGGGVGLDLLGRWGTDGTGGTPLAPAPLTPGTDPLEEGGIGAVWLLVSAVTGRPGGGGGAGLRTGSDPLKFFCWLRAAIRSLSELNWGSSVSAMMTPAQPCCLVRGRW